MALSCMNCTRVGTSYCKKCQIPLTEGDIQCISDFLGYQNLFTLEPLALEDIEPDYDPLWMPMVLKSNGLACVINRIPFDKVFNQIADILESNSRWYVKAGLPCCRE